jgi:phosphoribosylamine--glycine ligase
MSEKVNVLLVGGGGREHALAWKLSQSPRLGKLFITDPQNPGLASLGTPVDVPVDMKQIYRLKLFCEKNDVGLVVIGPEEPLAAGMGDALIGPGRAVFGPLAAAARLEADKAWCKQLLRAASVPMGEGRSFSDFAAAKAYVETREEPPVIKASGLCKGKGVVIPASLPDALAALDRIMNKLEFGEAGRTVVIEEMLEGPEVSIMALVDGRSIYLLEPCQDHKRLGDNDTGPNTGGMGAYCPGGLAWGHDDALIDQVQSEILVPTLDALRREGIEYRGVMFAGLMLTPAGPKVLEYNCRFGDPECQALMMRLDCDLIAMMLATARAGGRSLDELDIHWSPAASCCVVLASGGYPNKPRNGVPIVGIDKAQAVPGVQVFHAGTRIDHTLGPEAPSKIVTNGGRVLSVCAAADTIAEARRRAYEAAAMIQFEGKQMRTDIASKAREPAHA